jgi:uncharacterized protein (UPF0332 family)
MSNDLQDYIEYRLSRADSTLKDVKILANNDSWNSCVNRLYYACFYAVSALLIQKGHNIKSHNGIRTLFFKDFIATGIIEKEFGKLYSDLCDWRSEGDYADFVDYDEETVTPMIGKVEEFIGLIKNVIKTTWR